MKTLVFILVITVSALSVIPCCAFDNCEQDASHIHTESKRDVDGGLCSPFFSCSTCSGFTPISTLPIIPELLIAITQDYNIFVGSFCSSYLDNFWQPPKLS